MKTLFARLVAAALLALSLQAPAAECTYPHAPATMPDGGTAIKDEMIAAKKEYDKYNADMAVYLDCIKAEHEASLPKIDPGMSAKAKKDTQKQIDDSETRFVAKYDSAVDEVHSIMERFNEQIRVFNAKLQAKKDKS
jgi:hypothetical protein